MQRNIKHLSLVGALVFSGVCAMNASAVTTLTSGGWTLDFDDATGTITSWKEGATEHLGAGGIAFSTNVPYTLSFFGINGAGDSASWDILAGTVPVGTLDLNLSGSAGTSAWQLIVSIDGPLPGTLTISEAADLALNGTQGDSLFTLNAADVDIRDGLARYTQNSLGSYSILPDSFSFVQASSFAGPVGNQDFSYSWDFPQGSTSVVFSKTGSFTTQSQVETNVIPEPATTALGLLGLVAVGLRLTSRR